MNDMATPQAAQVKAKTSANVPTRASLSEMRPIPRRGLSRTEAAMYIRSIALDGRKLWDVRKLDVAFDALDPDPTDLSWANFEETTPLGRI